MNFASTNSIRQGESHQPGPALDARSDGRTSEEADSTQVNFALEIFGASWGQLVPSAALGPRFLSLGGHFGIIFGAFEGHFGSLGGSFGGLWAVLGRLFGALAH